MVCAREKSVLRSACTHGEVRVLATRNGWGSPKLTALQNALDALVTVDVNVAEVIDAYVEIDLYSQQHRDGARNMGKNDLWIAACAKDSGATLLTTDKDFDHFNRACSASSTSIPALRCLRKAGRSSAQRTRAQAWAVRRVSSAESSGENAARTVSSSRSIASGAMTDSMMSGQSWGTRRATRANAQLASKRTG